MNEKPEVPVGPKSGNPNTAVDNQTAASDDDNTSHKDFDPREYRPLEVVVSITMHDIQAHLVKVLCSYRISAVIEKSRKCKSLLILKKLKTARHFKNIFKLCVTAQCQVLMSLALEEHLYCRNSSSSFLF